MAKKKELEIVREKGKWVVKVGRKKYRFGSEKAAKDWVWVRENEE